MVQLAELDTERETLEATLSYFLDNKEMPVTLVGAPGESDKRVGGGDSEPHRVTLQNGRLHADEFVFEKNGFRFVDHDTRVGDFYDEDEIRRVYYPEMEALVKRPRRAPSASSSSITPCAPPTTICAPRRRSARSYAASITTTPNGRGRSGSAT